MTLVLTFEGELLTPDMLNFWYFKPFWDKVRSVKALKSPESTSHLILFNPMLMMLQFLSPTLT
jgi:hypothetical protein